MSKLLFPFLGVLLILISGCENINQTNSTTTTQLQTFEEKAQIIKSQPNKMVIHGAKDFEQMYETNETQYVLKINSAKHYAWFNEDDVMVSNTLLPGDTVHLFSACKTNTQVTCELVYMLQNNIITTTCIPNKGCNNCDLNIGVVYNEKSLKGLKNKAALNIAAISGTYNLKAVN